MFTVCTIRIWQNEEKRSNMELIDKLSKEDKDLIRLSWQIIAKNINDAAYHIFEMIFAQSPDTKAMFPFMKMSTNGSRSREMEFHGLRFMQVIESIVQCLDNPTSIEPLLDNLGRVHGRLAESRGFKVHHWGVFVECTLFYFRKVLSTAHQFSQMAVIDRVMIVWRTVLRTVIRRMKMGLNKDLKNRKANREMEEAGTTSDCSSPGLPHSLTLPVINGNQQKSKENENELFTLEFM